MAILLVNSDGSYASECAICNRPLTEPVFATTHFIKDPTDRLWKYSDAGMHWDCYANWKYQRRFASQYFEAAQQWKADNPYWPIVAQTEAFLLSANPNLPVSEADLSIRMIGPGFRVPIHEWTDWINGGWNHSCVHDLQRLAMLDIEKSVRQLFPDSETLDRLSRQLLKDKN
jgi:hypothetical protein